MILQIKNGMQIFEVKLGPITQLCGVNVPNKSFIINSICKHFSTEKYLEHENKYVNNIELNGNVPGRKHWECIRISTPKEIISLIQMSKTSIMGRLVRNYCQTFDCQTELMEIDEILMKLFGRINGELVANGQVELQYELADIVDIVSNAYVRTTDGKDIRGMSESELLKEMLVIIKQYQDTMPDKRLFVIENVDHYVDKKGYQEFAKQCETLSRESNAWFILCTSLDGYIYCSESAFDNINVINDDVISLGYPDKFLEYISENYPNNSNTNFEECTKELGSIVHHIGETDYTLSFRAEIILKLLNADNGIITKIKGATLPEIQYLQEKR